MVVAATIVVVLGVLGSRLIVGHHRTAQPVTEPSCGRSVNVGATYDARPTECLWRAYSAGTTAQATVVQYTIEGDPITFEMLVFSVDHVDVNIQSQDRYGPKGSFAYSCHGLTRQPIPNALGHPYLIVTDCTGPRDFLDVSRLTIP